jgi:hypothetical protein
VRVLRHLNVGGVDVTLVERRWVAYHLDAGHVLAVWHFAGRTYEVSLHGFEHSAELLDMVRALIAQMRDCPLDGPTARGSDPPCDLVFAAR